MESATCFIRIHRSDADIVFSTWLMILSQHLKLIEIFNIPKNARHLNCQTVANNMSNCRPALQYPFLKLMLPYQNIIIIGNFVSCNQEKKIEQQITVMCRIIKQTYYYLILWNEFKSNYTMSKHLQLNYKTTFASYINAWTLLVAIHVHLVRWVIDAIKMANIKNKLEYRKCINSREREPENHYWLRHFVEILYRNYFVSTHDW